ISASQKPARIFQKSRPIGALRPWGMAGSVGHELVAAPAHRLDPGTAVAAAAELLPDAAHMHVDAAVEPAGLAPQRLAREHLLADDAAGMAREHGQYLELGAGQLDWRIGQGRPALGRVQRER